MYFAKKMTKFHLRTLDYTAVVRTTQQFYRMSYGEQPKETDKHFRKYLEDLEKKLAIH